MGFPAPDNCFNCRMQNNKPDNFAVFIDDMKRPVLQTAISLRKSSISESDTCYNADIGFTAGTGGERANGRTSGGVDEDGIAFWTHNKYNATDSFQPAAIDAASAMLGAAQNHEILNWMFCNNIGCVEI